MRAACFSLSIAAILFTANASAATQKSTCPSGFEGPAFALSEVSSVDQAVDHLASLEGLLKETREALTASIVREVKDPRERAKLVAALGDDLQRIDVSLASWVDRVLSSSTFMAKEFQSDAVKFGHEFEALKSATRFRTKKTLGATFDELVLEPRLITGQREYLVPSRTTITGAESPIQVKVRFSDKVVEQLESLSIERVRHFIKAIEKGYVASRSGSGILKVPDINPNLVEIKVVPGELYRLMGCRRPNGLIEILAVYVKQNDGASGSLSRFASLCSNG